MTANKPSIADKTIFIGRLFLIFNALLHLLAPPTIITTKQQAFHHRYAKITVTNFSWQYNESNNKKATSKKLSTSTNK